MRALSRPDSKRGSKNCRRTKRREGAEQHADEVNQHRTELEAELAENKRVQAKLRQELEKAQKQQQAERDNAGAGQTRLEARIQELQATQAEVEQQVKRLTE